ncbi:MAG: hypothetical protein K0B02_03215 [DPANN group archaeon]|nr:hypothetical protein [DPANN group archaeon]
MYGKHYRCKYDLFWNRFSISNNASSYSGAVIRTRIRYIFLYITKI